MLPLEFNERFVATVARVDVNDSESGCAARDSPVAMRVSFQPCFDLLGVNGRRLKTVDGERVFARVAALGATATAAVTVDVNPVNRKDVPAAGSVREHAAD